MQMLQQQMLQQQIMQQRQQRQQQHQQHQQQQRHHGQPPRLQPAILVQAGQAPGSQHPMMPRRQPGGMMPGPGQQMSASGAQHVVYDKHGLPQSQLGQVAPYGMTQPYAMGIHQGEYGMLPLQGQPPMSQQQPMAFMNAMPGQPMPGQPMPARGQASHSPL